MKPKLKRISSSILLVIFGIILGGYLFSNSRSRSFLAFDECQNCMQPNELLGLVASIGIQKAPGLIPSVVLETDKTIVINHPTPSAEHHYVIFPKKDIKNVGEIADEDQQYLTDIYAVTTELIRKSSISEYRMWTNGPGTQIVSYLHFHLAGS